MPIRDFVETIQRHGETLFLTPSLWSTHYFQHHGRRLILSSSLPSNQVLLCVYPLSNRLIFSYSSATLRSALKASGKYGLSTRGPSFNNVLVDNRQNPILATFLAALIGCPIQVSHFSICSNNTTINAPTLILDLF